MNRLAVTVMGVFLSGALHGAESVNQRLDADPDGRVQIDVVRGSVTVTGWDQNTVHVQGTRDDDSREFIFERDGRVIRIEDELESGSRGGGDGNGTRITVQVPRNSTVELETVSASQNVGDVSGSVQLESVSGDVVATNIGGGAELTSVSGKITLSGGSGEVRVDSVSGDVTADMAAERLWVDSVSGDVTVNNAGTLKRLEASTVSGDLHVRTALGADADVSLESVSGDVELALRGDPNADFSLETGPGGDIENQLTDVRPERERYTGSESLEMRLGQGEANVEASVISGTITIRKD
ncbi:MAG: DUF4097 family beta strand repeat protein [Gammaproteobacteria bacterium]|nr:DUF4097 family beta strand repeat protein [Gammaproteobacteria bacterium]